MWGSDLLKMATGHEKPKIRRTARRLEDGSYDRGEVVYEGMSCGQLGRKYVVPSSTIQGRWARGEKGAALVEQRRPRRISGLEYVDKGFDQWPWVEALSLVELASVFDVNYAAIQARVRRGEKGADVIRPQNSSLGAIDDTIDETLERGKQRYEELKAKGLINEKTHKIPRETCDR